LAKKPPAARGDGPILGRERGTIFCNGRLIAMFDEQPILSLGMGVAFQTDDHPGAMQACACENEFEFPFTQRSADIVKPIFRGPIAAVP
jgi:hypothetical protein